MDDNVENELKAKSEPKKGRRAGKVRMKSSKDSINGPSENSSLENIKNLDKGPTKAADLGQRPSRRQMGWDKTSSTSLHEQLDVRLMPDAGQASSDEESHIIPDIEAIHEDNILQEVAAPPSIFTSNIASYKDLDVDLMTRSAFRTLDGDIDLKALVKNLPSELEVQEEPDAPWEWEALFAEVSSQLKAKEEQVTLKEPLNERVV